MTLDSNTQGAHVHLPDITLLPQMYEENACKDFL